MRFLVLRSQGMLSLFPVVFVLFELLFAMFESFVRKKWIGFVYLNIVTGG